MKTIIAEKPSVAREIARWCKINKYPPVITIQTYLSSRKLLLLNPPKTPLKSLPTTKNTNNKIIISPIGLIFYSYIQLKDTKK